MGKITIRLNVTNTSYANILSYTFNCLCRKSIKKVYDYVLSIFLELCKYTCLQTYQLKKSDNDNYIIQVFEFNDSSKLSVYDINQVEGCAVVSIGDKPDVDFETLNKFTPLTCTYADAIYHILQHIHVVQSKNKKFSTKCLNIYLQYAKMCSCIIHTYLKFDDEIMTDNSSLGFEFIDCSILTVIDPLQKDGICRIYIKDEFGSENDEIQYSEYGKMLKTFEEAEMPIQ